MPMQSRLVVVVFSSQNEKSSKELEPDFYNHEYFAGVTSVLDRITSVCEIDEYGACFFPVRGPAKYFGGEKALAHHVYESMSEAFPDLQCGVGIGDSRLIARLAAVASRDKRTPVITPAGKEHLLVADLPSSVLCEYCEIDSDLVSLFQRLGLYTLSDLARIGETSLVDRFGVEGRNVYRLAIGGEVELFSPVDTGNPVVVSCDLDNQSHHSLSDALNDVNILMSMLQSSIYEFIDALQWSGMQCLRMRIRCETENSDVENRVWYNSDGFDPVSVHDRLQWQLTHWMSSFDDPTVSAPCVTKVVLEALHCRTFHAEQETLWGGRSESTEQVVRALSRVASVDEAISITVPQWQGGRDVGTFIQRPWSSIDFFNDDASLVRVQKHYWNGALPAPQPMMLCDPPEQVMLCDEKLRPVVVTARHELSQRPVTITDQQRNTWNVLTWAGPWPIEERWWDPQRRRRHARLQVLVQRHSAVDQSEVWLLSTQSRQWHIVGMYC